MGKPKPLKLDVPQYDYVERGGDFPTVKAERLWFYIGGMIVGFIIATVIFL